MTKIESRSIGRREDIYPWKVEKNMNVEKYDGYAVVLLPERVTVFDSAEKFNEIMGALYNEGYNKVVLDFSNLTMIDTRGLSSLLVSQKNMKDRGGELIITNIACKYIREKFNLIELRKVINITDEDSKNQSNSNY